MSTDFIILTDAMLDGDSLKKQEILKECQSLEIRDREAVLKLISSVQWMLCAKVTELKDSLMASKGSDALEHLVVVNCTFPIFDSMYFPYLILCISCASFCAFHML